jgi:uncharacterized protein YoxC
VSEKQDRHGVRTATDLERKYNFGKTFAELIGLITDARESVDAASSTLRGEMEKQATSLRRDSEQIVANALKEYVKETELEEVRKYAESEFKVTAEQISANLKSTTEQIQNVSGDVNEVREYAEAQFEATAKQISATLEATTEQINEVSGDVNGVSDAVSEVRDYAKGEFEATARNLSASFESTKEMIGDVNGRLQGVVEKLEKHFEFNVDGLTIKAGPGTMSLQLDNDIIRFYKNGQEFGWWDGVDFHTGNIYIAAEERAQFGNFAFTPRSNGSMDFGKVGG